MSGPDKLSSLRCRHHTRLPMGASCTVSCTCSENATLLPKKANGQWQGRSGVSSRREQKSRIMVGACRSTWHGLPMSWTPWCYVRLEFARGGLLQEIKKDEVRSETGRIGPVDQSADGFASIRTRRTFQAHFVEVGNTIIYFPRVSKGQNRKTDV